MEVLLVGAGRMGCAHLRGLAHSDRFERISIIEPDGGARQVAQRSWDATAQSAGKELAFVDWDGIRVGACSAAVIATSAPGRLALVGKCAERGIPFVLAEKILFQSVDDYREAMRLSDAARMKVHAHLPYRTARLFQTLRERLAGRRFAMTVTVGDRGLGCNAVHFLDLCHFINGGKVDSITARIDLPLRDNPRGDRLVEFSGRVLGRFSTGSEIEIVYEKGHANLPVIEVRPAKDTSGVARLRVDMDGGKIDSDDAEMIDIGFEIPMASRAAHLLVEDIMAAGSVLPDLEQGLELNRMMLNAFNLALSGHAADDMACPIT